MIFNFDFKKSKNLKGYSKTSFLNSSAFIQKKVHSGSALFLELDDYCKSYSSIFQNIYYLSKNSSGAEFFTEKLNSTDIDFKDLEKRERDSVILQFLTALEIIKSNNLRFIDMSKFYVDKYLSVRFELSDKPVPIEYNYSYVREKFPQIKLGRSLEKNVNKPFILGPGNRIHFDPERIFYFRFNEFTTELLYEGLKTLSDDSGPISILFNTKNRLVKKYIKNIVLNYLIHDNVLGIIVDNYMPEVLSYLKNLLKQIVKNDNLTQDDILEGLRNLISGSEFRTIVFVIDRKLTKIESDLLNQIKCNTNIYKNIKIFSLSEEIDITFDIEISDDSSNIFRNHLKKNKKNEELLSKTEIEIIKQLIVFPLKITETDRLFQEKAGISEELIRKKIIIRQNGRLYVNDLIKEKYKLQISEESIILKTLDKVLGNHEIRFLIYLKDSDWGNAIKLIEDLPDGEPGEKLGYIRDLDTMIRLNPDLIVKDVRLIEASILLLLRSGNMDTIDRIIELCDDELATSLGTLIRFCYGLKGEIFPDNEDIGWSVPGKKSVEKNDYYYGYRAIRNSYDNNTYKFSNSLNKIKRNNIKILSELFHIIGSLTTGYVSKPAVRKIINTISEYQNNEPDFLVYCLSEILNSEMEFTDCGFLSSVNRLKRLYYECSLKDLIFLCGKISADLGGKYFKLADFSNSEFWLKRAEDIFKKNGYKYNLLKVNLLQSKLEINSGKIKNFISILNKKKFYDVKNRLTRELLNDFFESARLLIFQNRVSDALAAIDRGLNITFRRVGKESNKISEYFHHIKNILSQYNKRNTVFSDRSNSPDNGSKPESYITEHNYTRKISGDRPVGLPELLNSISAIPSFEDKFLLLISILLVSEDTKVLDLMKSQLDENLTDVNNLFYYELMYYQYIYTGVTMGNGNNARSAIFENMYGFYLSFGKNISEKIIAEKKLYDAEISKSEIIKTSNIFERYRRWRTIEDFFLDIKYELNRIVKPGAIYFCMENDNKPLYLRSNDAGYEKIAAEMFNQNSAYGELQFLNQNEVRSLSEDSKKIFYHYSSTILFKWLVREKISAAFIIFFKKHWDRYGEKTEKLKRMMEKYSSLFTMFYENVLNPLKKLESIVGQSLPVRQLKEEIRRISKVDFSVLITGESGTGKELVAQSLHRLGKRNENSFVPVNAASIPENLLESELFGNIRGAFTDAHKDRMGLIESANGGTLFLDEIGELPLNLQSKLLRVIQEMEIKRVGDTKYRKIDVRFIFATNRDLKKMVSDGSFRNDLFYRIQDIVIEVPPLRSRVEDIPLLADHFFSKFGFDSLKKYERKKIYRRFSERSWDGNIRELESAVKRIITFYPDIGISDTKDEGLNRKHSGLINERENFEQKLIMRELEKSNWSRTKTAESLMISRTYLFQLMKKYNINKNL